MPKTITRHDTAAAAFVDESGTTTGIRTKCPHCGMVDYQYSSQGLHHSHFDIWRVGALRRYQCGKCRKMFHTIELCVPHDIDALQYYEMIRRNMAEQEDHQCQNSSKTAN